MRKRNLNPEAKRVWFITDTHLGVRNSSNEWIEIIGDYFFKWFIPLVKENYQPGDVLIHLGDWYDSRQSVNLKVLNLGVEVAEEMSKIFKDGIYIIAGNHDVWGKNSNEINSLKSIKWIPGVELYEEPETLVLGQKKFLMIPWRKDHESEEEILDSSSPHDYVCCHADIRGLKFNRYVNVENGADLKKFSKFGRVYSGHIHYAQEVSNIRMLGSPYELTRSDMGNQKSVTLLNLETGEEKKYLNNFSPKFKRYYFQEILNLTIEQLEPEFRNNFIDILIDPKIALKSPLNILTDLMITSRRITFHPYDPNGKDLFSPQILDSDGRQFSVMDFITEYVSGMEIDSRAKEKLIQSLEKLHRIVVERDKETKL